MAKRKKSRKKNSPAQNTPKQLVQNDLTELKQIIIQKREAFYVGAVALTIGIVIGVLIPQKNSSLKESLDTKVKLRDNRVNQAQKKQKPIDTYTLKENESLWDIAQKFYNNPFLYTKIAKDNNIINPDLIEPGTKLKIYPIK